MYLISLPQSPDTILPFYLAAEEWAARSLPAGKYFFAWQVEPTVICGRHQEMAAEVDLNYASEHDIKVWRRKSGGGAVYADRNNIMFSYITQSTDVQTTFEDYTAMICAMLRTLGIEANPTGRNDIAVNGRKVAGNAFLKLPGRSIVHGTMLYDADFESMSHVLTPSRAKRESKCVVSVPSLITTLRSEGLNMNCDDFIRHATDYLCNDGIITPTTTDIAAIEDIMQTYLDPGYLRRDKRCRHAAKYYDGVGQLKADIKVDARGCISDISLWGDFLPLRPIEPLLHSMRGIPPDIGTLREALPPLEPECYISGLTCAILADAIVN